MLDLLEDAVKLQMPSIVDAVRVEELDLGLNPIKIIGFRRLDPSEQIAENYEPEDDNSRFVNMEVDFAYQGQNREKASDNTHMIIHIAAGLHKLQTVEMPIFVELQAVRGIVRVRLELVSDTPFFG